MKLHAWALMLGLALVLGSSTAVAQQPATSGDTASVKSDDAAQNPERSGGGFVANLRNWAEEHRLVDRLNGDVDGWYPRLGGMTRGAGFALGPGYRRHFGDVLVDVSAGLSIRRYMAVDTRVRWWQAAGERLELWTDYRFEEFPQEDFFGTGSDSRLENRTSYGFRSHEFTARAIARPARWMRTGVTLGYMRPTIGTGQDDRYPSIEELFIDAAAPGLADQPNYMHTTLFADVDTRDERGHPRSGGFYHAAFALWNALDDSLYDFRRFDVNVQQFVPLTSDKKHMVSGRVGLSYVNNITGHRVPFYFLPYVGGVDTVRSFREFRFKDENAIWVGGEYDYAPIKWISVAAFVDGGKVEANWESINLRDLKPGYGFGFRVHSRKQTFLRVDYGMGGGEGRRIFFKLGGF